MKKYERRTYRKRAHAKDLISFHVRVKETDLWVSAASDLRKEVEGLVIDQRYQLEKYIQSHPDFLTTLRPYPIDIYAPPIVREMIRQTRDIDVGPMAAVAGAMAQFVGSRLLGMTDQGIIENGGDIFLKVNRQATVSLFAGDSPISGKLGFLVNPDRMPLGICSSSGTVGHSLSMGSADVICLISKSAIRADGAATALGNRIRTKSDLKKAAELAGNIEGILGGVAILGDRMASWGDIELVGL